MKGIQGLCFCSEWFPVVAEISGAGEGGESRTESLVEIGEGSLVFSEERGFPSVGTGEENEKGNSHPVPNLSWEGLERDWHLDP